jgi:hypothetical protein
VLPILRIHVIRQTRCPVPTSRGAAARFRTTGTSTRTPTMWRAPLLTARHDRLLCGQCCRRRSRLERHQGEQRCKTDTRRDTEHSDPQMLH